MGNSGGKKLQDLEITGLRSLGADGQSEPLLFLLRREFRLTLSATLAYRVLGKG
jgi:hypothetical protein